MFLMPVLDACAVIAVAKQEQGHEVVTSLFTKAINNNASLFIHQINLLEVYNYISKYHNTLAADTMSEEIKKLPITVVKDFSMKYASKFYIMHKVSIADSIALATAQEYNAILVTADYHDMKQIERIETLQKFLWIR